MHRNDILLYLKDNEYSLPPRKRKLLEIEKNKINLTNDLSIKEICDLNIKRLEYHYARILSEQLTYDDMMRYQHMLESVNKTFEMINKTENKKLINLLKLQITYLQVEFDLDVYFDSKLYDLLKICLLNKEHYLHFHDLANMVFQKERMIH